MSYDIEALKQKQLAIQQKVDLRGNEQWLSSITTVAGADISSSRFSKVGYAAIVMFTYPDLVEIEKASCQQILGLPYIPGYLAFREWPLVKECLRKLSAMPDLLLCDGQGYAHPRHAGLACHIGVESGITTIGCAKSRLVGEYEEPGLARGSTTDLTYKGKKIGEVLRTRERVKPLFISPGHKISFQQSSQMVLNLSLRYRQPEPIRAAHKYVNLLRKETECG